MFRAATMSVFGALLIVASEAPASASFLTGNQLYADCTAERGTASYLESITRCNGYVIGTMDSFDVYTELEKNTRVCIPGRVNTAQLRDLVVAELRANPAVR